MKSGSLANRVRIGFAITFALLVGVTVIGAALLFEARHDYEQATTRSFESEIAAERMRQTFLIEQMALPAAAAGDERSLDRLRQAQDEGEQAVADARALGDADARVVELIGSHEAALERWRALVVAPALSGDPPAEGLQARLGQRVLDADRALIRTERERRVQLADNVSDSTRDTTILIGAGIVCGLIAAILLFTGLVASMRRPLERLVEASGQLASGDLATRVQIGGPSETVALGRAFNEMASELQVAHWATEESRARLAATLEHLADGIITIERDGEITDTNPAAGRLLPEAEVGSAIQDALSGRVASADLARLMSGSLDSEIEVPGDGDSVLAITASPLGEPGSGAVISVRDISERVRLERLKDEFVLTASHELRSPLTSILGFAEILKMQSENMSKAQVETVDIILDNTRHLERLLNDLLDLARSDAGQLTINPEPTDVEPLVESSVRSMLASTEAKFQTLSWRIAPKLPKVMVEPDRIRQILANLLTNAHEYCPDRAEIEVDVQPTAEGGVEISVTDDGPGIPPDQLGQIFERFTRGDAGLTQRVGGTGLGLAISKSLIDLHGGTIEALSPVHGGRGSCFRFTLPPTTPERHGLHLVRERAPSA